MRIGYSCERVWFVWMDSNQNAFAFLDSSPNPEGKEKHQERVRLPGGTVTSPDSIFVGYDFCSSTNGRAFLAADKTDDSWVAAYSLHFIGSGLSCEFDAAVIYNKPNRYLLQLA